MNIRLSKAPGFSNDQKFPLVMFNFQKITDLSEDQLSGIFWSNKNIYPSNLNVSYID